MEYAIETRQMTRDFAALRAVDALDLKVPRGCFYGFLGPNGAGKSTTIRMLTGLMAPTAGAATVLGEDMATGGLAAKARIGVVPEDLCLFDNLTAREYLIFIGRMYRVEKPDRPRAGNCSPARPGRRKRRWSPIFPGMKKNCRWRPR